MFKRARSLALAEIEASEEVVEEAQPEKEGGDNDLLKVLKAQRERSIGFDDTTNDTDLNTERADALDYYKGKHEGAIARDLPVTGTNLSKVVSTDVANQVEAAIPVIIDIFTAGKDPLYFKPRGPEDIDGSKQETAYVKDVVFNKNDGWLVFYTAIKDALISKTGIFHFYWSGEKEYEEWEVKGTEPQIEEIIEQGNELVGVEEMGVVSEDGFPVVNATFRKCVKEGQVTLRAIPPEDFAVQPETVLPLKNTGWCAWRRREQRQTFIDEGYDKKAIMKLSPYEESEDGQESQARDTVLDRQNKGKSGAKLLEVVEVVIHYIRYDAEDTGESQIWRVVTGNDDGVIIEKEKRSMIEFAAITPYPMTHRFFGQSLADKSITTQKWKTSITRAVNNHFYHANSQRQEVKLGDIVPGVTLEQLVKNDPGSYIITNSGNGLRPVQNGSLGIDAMALLEYINVDQETKTGVVRNTQGLKPDTMHETKGGAEMLLATSQTRHRMIARVFAEVGIRDMYLGIHELCRANATMKDTVRQRNKWVPVDPSTFGRRSDMTIKIGIGSAGDEDELNALREARGVVSELVEGQGGLEAKEGIVDKGTIYQLAVDTFERLGLENATAYIKDPTQIQEEAAEAAASGEQEQPPPEVQAELMKLEVDKQTEAARMELAQQQAEFDSQIELMKLQKTDEMKRKQMELDFALEKMKQDNEFALAKARAEFEAKLAQDNADREFALAERRAQQELKIASYKAKRDADNDAEDIKQNRPGGSLAE